MTYCYGCPAEQAAATDGGDDRIRCLYICKQLHRRRSLSGDDIEVIKRMDHGCACTLNHCGGGGLACLQRGLAEGYLRPVGRHGPLLYLRGCGGHDDVCLHPARHGSMRQRRRMVARRVGDNPGGTLLRRQVHDGVGGAPELEGPHLLQVLALEEEMRTTG